MSQARTHVVDATTETLLDVLSAWQNDIVWAPLALSLFQTIRSIYKAYAQTLDAPDHVWELEDKVKELERYLMVDLEVHISSRNGRTPYHLRRIYQHLEKVTDLIGQHLITGDDGRRRFVGSPMNVKDFDHLAAELQSTFVEYGFCQNYEALYNIEEITRRLNGIGNKLTKVEKVLSDPEGSTSTAITELREAIAEQHGIQQAITEQNLGKIAGLYEKITDRIIVLENTISRERLQKDSEVFQRYVEAQKCLQNSVMHDMFYADPMELINEHNIHPGTRGWLLERVHRWFNSTNKRIFFVAAKTGVGKTAMASTICKLYGSNIMASYFFDKTQNNAQLNTLHGMLQSLSAEMCKAVPEYLAYLEAKFNNVSLSSQLGSSWKQTYNILFKEPLVALYGSGPKSLYRRRLLVVDAVDELQESEWNDFKEFLNSFKRDLSPCISLFITVRARYFSNLVVYDDDLMEGIRLEDRAWVNRHIKDIEIYLSSCLGAILSGEDEVDAPLHAKADEHTLQNTVDDLLKCSAGRFDNAIEIMEAFAQEMRMSQGQFLSSIKKAMAPMSKNHASDNTASDFASPYRAYRDKEGRSVAVRVMRQSMYPMDKSRVALIRGRHRISELQN